MGNPHAVQLINEPVAGYPLEDIGPRVATHPLFPRGTNFEVARVIDRKHIEARVWERGAGLTLACGSGRLRADGRRAPAGPGRRHSRHNSARAVR